MASTAQRAQEPDEPISYEQWGIDFFPEAISEDRVLGAVDTIAGQPIDFGPIEAGPGRIAKVRAYGEIGEPRPPGPRGDHDRLPGAAARRPHLRGRPPGRDPAVRGRAAGAADADGRGPRGRADLHRGQPPRSEEMQVELRAKGLRASVLQRVVGRRGRAAAVRGRATSARAGEAARPARRPGRSTSARAIDRGVGLDRISTRRDRAAEETLAGDLEGR